MPDWLKPHSPWPNFGERRSDLSGKAVSPPWVPDDVSLLIGFLTSPWKYPSTRLFTDQEERTARCPVAYGSAKAAEQSVAGPIVGGLGGFVDATWQGGNVRPNVLVGPRERSGPDKQGEVRGGRLLSLIG